MSAPTEHCPPVEDIHAALQAQLPAAHLVSALRRAAIPAEHRQERIEGTFGPLVVDVVVVADDTGAGWVLNRAGGRGAWSALWCDAEGAVRSDVVSAVFGRGLVRGRDLAVALVGMSRGGAL